MEEPVLKELKSRQQLGCITKLFIFLALIWIILILCGSILIVGDKIKQVDAIAVLSGDEGERVNEAINLFLEGYGNYFVITKTDKEEIGENLTYSEKLKRIAIDGGVASDSIFITSGESTSTIDEAEAIKLLAQKRNIQSILIVTAPYHTRRTKLIFTQVFKDSDISVYVHPVKDSWYKPFSWYFSVEGWKLTLNEYGGLIYLWWNQF